MNNSIKISITNDLSHDIFQQILSGEVSILLEESGVKYKTFVHENSRIYSLPALTKISSDRGMTTFYFGEGNSDGDLYNHILPTIVKEEIKE